MQFEYKHGAIVNISNFTEVEELCKWASSIDSPALVTDYLGNTADPRSILCLVSLQYSVPVHVECDDEDALKALVRTLVK